MEGQKVRASIVMATYNGEKYIKEQLDSIIRNISKLDEIIISDDGSKDNTINIIKEYIQKDNRIKLFEGPRKRDKAKFCKCN